MKSKEYSIVIRTLGTAGCKYQALLDSINAQTLLPKEVIVVIPHGYELPPERLGYEKFVRSEKGMVIQRCVGLSEMTTELGLFLDDDLSFDSRFAETLVEGIDKYDADVVFPILKELLPQTKKQKFLAAITFSAIPFKSSKWYTKIYRNGSYGYCNQALTEESYYAMTAPGACFLTKKASFEQIHFEEELWLESTPYALPEDQVMFYKFFLNNSIVKGLTTCLYNHLDAGGKSIGRAQIAAYSMSRNKLIFWHRFIYSYVHNKINCAYSLLSYIMTVCVNITIAFILTLIGLKPFILTKESIKGLIDGYKFIHSYQYKTMTPVSNKSSKRNLSI